MNNDAIDNDTINETSSPTQEDTEQVTHLYYDVGSDLLSKPNMLCDIIEGLGIPTTLVYCNTPSDADFADVVLRKRGINSKKLIGNIPHMRISQSLEQLRTRQIEAIVITDVAARDLDVDPAELVVNYGLPSDPEIYLHRTGKCSVPGANRRIASLVSPLDFGNFHYLKKVVDFDFVKGETPSGADLGRAKLTRLVSKAASGPHLEDEKLQSLLQEINASPEKDAVYKYLLHNTLNVLPMLQSDGSESVRGSEERDARGNRAPRDNGRDRDRRHGGRGGYGRGRRDDDYDSYSDSDDGRSGNRDRSDDRPGRDSRRDNRQGRPSPRRDVRVYVGNGFDDGLSEESLVDMICQNAGLQGGDIKRVSLKGLYGFFDVEESNAESVVSKLEGLTLSSGKPLFVKKAIAVPQAREKMEEGPAHFDEHREESENRSFEEEAE